MRFDRHLTPPRFMFVVTAALMACSSVVADVFIPPDLEAGDSYHLVFVTRGVHDATQDDIGVYNAFVNEETSLSDLTRGASWAALISTAFVDARDRVTIEAPVYNLSGVLVADGFDDMWDGVLHSPIDHDQFGAALSGSNYVFTGSREDGTAVEGEVVGSPSLVTVASNFLTESGWMNDNEKNAAHELHFYALSERLTVVPEPGGCSLLVMGLLVFLRHGRTHRPI